MDVHAHLRNVRMSPRKVRLVANLIRGLPVEQAQTQLQFLMKRPSLPLLKLLHSAVANATHNFKLKPEELYVREIAVNQGSTLKRGLPASRGRVLPIKKRTSHVSLTLSEKKDRYQYGMRKKSMPKGKEGQPGPRREGEKPSVPSRTEGEPNARAKASPKGTKKRLTGLARRVFQKHET